MELPSTVKAPSNNSHDGSHSHTVSAYIYRRAGVTVAGDGKDFVLTLRAVPGNWQASPLVRLRRLLKCLLRGYGFKAVNIHTEQPKPRTERNEP
jgi:hypothetical protein